MDALKSRLYDDAFVGDKEENSEGSELEKNHVEEKTHKEKNYNEETSQLATVTPTPQQHEKREKDSLDGSDGIKDEIKDHKNKSKS